MLTSHENSLFNPLVNNVFGLLKSRFITLLFMSALSFLTLTVSSFSLAQNTIDATFESIQKITGGKPSFVKTFEGRTYIGAINGKLYEQDSATKQNRVISPVDVNGINDLLFIDDTYFISTGVGLYLSHDGLETWEPAKNSDLISQGVYMVTPHKSALYAAAENGIYQSDDGGNSWTRLENTTEDSKESSRFIVSNGSQLLIFNFQNQYGYGFMRYSDDDGKTWQFAGKHQNKANYFVNFFSGIPVTIVDDTFYAGVIVFPEDPLKKTYEALVSSQDGKTWTEVQKFQYSARSDRLTHDENGYFYISTTSVPLPSEAEDNAFDYAAQIYMGQPGSDDWELIYQARAIPTFLGVLENQVLIGAEYGQILAYNPGSSQEPEISSTITSGYVNTMAVGDDTLYVSISDALTAPASYDNENCKYHTTLQMLYANGTATISKHDFDTAVVDMDSHPDLLLTITCGGQISYSIDQGRNFTDITPGLAYSSGDLSRVVLFDGKVYGTSGKGIFQFSDYTTPSPKMKNVHALDLFHENILKMVSAKANGLFAVSNTKGVLHSENGTQWETFNNGLSNVTDIRTLDYDNNGTLLGAYNGVYQAQLGINGSITNAKWSDVTNNLNALTDETINTIKVNSDQLIVATTENGIFIAYLHDYSWNQVGKGLNTKLYVDVLWLDKNHFLLGTGNNGAYNGTLN